MVKDVDELLEKLQKEAKVLWFALQPKIIILYPESYNLIVKVYERQLRAPELDLKRLFFQFCRTKRKEKYTG